MRSEESQRGGSQRAGLSGVVTLSWILEDTGEYMHAVLGGSYGGSRLAASNLWPHEQQAPQDSDEFCSAQTHKHKT